MDKERKDKGTVRELTQIADRIERLRKTVVEETIALENTVRGFDQRDRLEKDPSLQDE